MVNCQLSWSSGRVMHVAELFSFIGNSTLRSFTLRERPLRDRVWTHIESRQFIGWWRDAVSDAMTSSGHTGERAIHSSDFSAFTKWSHCPSLLRFLTQLLPLRIIHLHFGDCLSGTLFSSRWCAMEFRRCIPPCARFIAREDPHSKCILCLGFSHAREAVYGTSKCKICDNFRLITLRSRLEDYERESSIFPRRASSTSAAPREIAASRRAASWGSDVRYL